VDDTNGEIRGFVYDYFSDLSRGVNSLGQSELQEQTVTQPIPLRIVPPQFLESIEVPGCPGTRVTGINSHGIITGTCSSVVSFV